MIQGGKHYLISTAYKGTFTRMRKMQKLCVFPYDNSYNDFTKNDFTNNDFTYNDNT